MLTLDQKYRHYHHADLRNGPGIQVAVHKVSSGGIFKISDVRVNVGRPDHQPVTPTIGFRIEAEGKSVVLAGDTVPRNELNDLCRGADLYVQTILRPDLVELVKQSGSLSLHTSMTFSITTRALKIQQKLQLALA